MLAHNYYNRFKKNQEHPHKASFEEPNMVDYFDGKNIGQNTLPKLLDQFKKQLHVAHEKEKIKFEKLMQRELRKKVEKSSRYWLSRSG